ncbi:MAG: phosphotransferase [Planctomycetota bacterium]
MDEFLETVKQLTGASDVRLGESIQSLWSGYGVIQRAELSGVRVPFGNSPVQVVIKHIDLSQARSNRRGWGGDASHRRKVRSYEVESRFYESFSHQCDDACRVPAFVATHEKSDDRGWIIVLEDLDANGFNRRKKYADQHDIEACLSWLAHFHATFLSNAASGLWPVGTYWHLETRPDEFAAMRNGPLKEYADLIDRRLSNATFQTLVHGDAKLANFCFSDRNHTPVAAVDFQYVGRGCGMKDVAYFISSCLDEREAAAQQDSLLAFYFGQLKSALQSARHAIEFNALEREWRDLYPIAWADFCRFLLGWSPDHWKLNAYSDQMTQAAIDQLETRD